MKGEFYIFSLYCQYKLKGTIDLTGGEKNGPNKKTRHYFREDLPGRLFIRCVLAPYTPSAASIRVSVRVG